MGHWFLRKSFPSASRRGRQCGNHHGRPLGSTYFRIRYMGPRVLGFELRLSCVPNDKSTLSRFDTAVARSAVELISRQVRGMRAYGPGHPQPLSSGHANDGDHLGSESESEGGDSQISSSGEEVSDSDASVMAAGGLYQARQRHDPAAFRPWTLPHEDYRVQGEQGAIADGGDPKRRAGRGGIQSVRVPPPTSSAYAPHRPTVIVHPTSSTAPPLPVPPQGPEDVWTIRPRAGSGRASLGRRRRYDSYVSTLDLEELQRLDEELLRRAIGTEEEMVLEEQEEEDDECGVPEQGQQRQRRRQRGRKDDYEDHRYGCDGLDSVPRRMERLCDESATEGEEEEMKTPRDRQQQRRRLSPPRHRLGPHNQHLREDEEKEVNGKGDAAFRDSAGIRRSAHNQSPLRAHRSESRTRGAPPPKPTFYDPKMGPLPPQAPSPSSDGDSDPRGSRRHHQQQQPISARRSSGMMMTGAGGIGHLSCKRVDSRGSNKMQQSNAYLGQEDDHNEEGQAVVGDEAASGRRDRRDSGVSVGIRWLYGSNADGGDDNAEARIGGHAPGKRTLLHWLDQRLPRMKEEERIARAAMYLSDAIDTRPVRMRGGGKGSLFAYRLQKRAGWMRMMQTLAVTHLLLALWEPPRALPNDALYQNSVARHELTGAASTAMHILGVEVILVLLFLLDVFLEIYALGVDGFFGLNAPMGVLENKGRSAALQAKLWGQARFALVVLFFADVCNSLDKSDGTAMRFSRPLRPLYLICLSETLKRWSVLLVHLMAKLRDVALGTCIFLGLFSLLGLILFSETGYYDTSLPYLNFNNFLNSFIALYVLMTTQNFGALLNPAYNADPKASTPLYFFFFMAFVLIVVLFLAHLALPRVFWVYQSFQRKQAYECRLLERLALLMTFRCLDPDKRGWIDLSSFRSMLRYARPDLFDLHTGYEKDTYCGTTEHMFGQLAKAHPGRVYPHEFLSVCEVILTDYYPVVPTLEPGMTASEWHQRERARFRAIFNSKYMEVALMALLLLTCFFLTFYGSPVVSKASLRGFAYFVIITFTAEMLLKIWAYGPKPFAAEPSNVVDFLIIGCAFFSLIAYAFSPPHSSIRESEQMANLCLVFLTLRIVRLFPKCAIFHKFSSAFRVLPFFLSSFTLCVLISYVWAVFGMTLFARYSDQIHTVSQQDLEGWASVDNFNCFWSASVTLFQVATTYDWYKIMYLWMNVSRSAWTALYFMFFHLIANIVVFQLTAALFIDAFLSFNDKRWVEQEEEEEEDEDASSGRGGRYDMEKDDEDAMCERRERQRWSQRSAASAPSPTPSDDMEGQQQQRYSTGSSSPSRRASGRDAGLTHSASYQATVI